ncbi:MAG: Crp/Fnr family transcriptional regulator [Egibacteraceae bacterium]
MEWPILRGLSEEDRHRVLTAARRRTFSRREVIFHEGDPGDTLHLIGRGRVAIRVTTSQGDVATLAVLGPGDTFGELALVSHDFERTATVVALEKTETLVLRRGPFEELRRAHPSVDRFLVDLLTSQVRRLSDLLVEALFTPAETRVIRRLLAVAEVYGSLAPGTTVPLTQADLASLAGTSRATANRVLRAAQEAGALRLARNHIELLDVPALNHLARH